MAVKLSAAGLSYLMFVVLARWLGADDYGQYASAFSAGTFLSYVMLAGLNSEILRRLPALEGDSDSSGARRVFLATALKGQALALLAVGAIGMLVALAAYVLGSAGWGKMILLAIGFGAALALAEFLASVFRALGAVNIALVPRDMLWRILLIGTVAGLAALGTSPSLALAATLSIVLLLLSLAVQILAGRRLLPPKGDTSSKAQITGQTTPRGLIWDARWLAVAALASNLLQPLGVVVVGVVLSYSDSGLFFAAQRTAALLSLPLLAMNMIGAPQIARAWSKSGTQEVQRICTHIALVASAGTAVGFLIVLGLSGQLLGIFNPAYSDGGLVLIILAFGNMLNSLAGASGNLMMMTGHARQLVFLSAIGQGSGLVLVLLGGYFWSIEGAAVGEALGILIVNAAIIVWARSKLKIDPSVLSIVRK